MITPTSNSGTSESIVLIYRAWMRGHCQSMDGGSLTEHRWPQNSQSKVQCWSWLPHLNRWRTPQWHLLWCTLAPPRTTRLLAIRSALETSDWEVQEGVAGFPGDGPRILSLLLCGDVDTVLISAVSRTESTATRMNMAAAMLGKQLSVNGAIN